MYFTVRLTVISAGSTTFNWQRTHSRKRPALVTITFWNFRGCRLRELRLFSGISVSLVMAIGCVITSEIAALRETRQLNSMFSGVNADSWGTWCEESIPTYDAKLNVHHNYFVVLVKVIAL